MKIPSSLALVLAALCSATAAAQGTDAIDSSSSPAESRSTDPSVSANNPVIVPSEADVEWEGLKDLSNAPTIAGLDDALDQTSIKSALVEHGLDLIVRADRLRDFINRNPRSDKSAGARKLEALLLIQALQSGDKAVEHRKNSTVEAFRKDPSVPEQDRAEVAGVSDFTAIARDYGTTSDRLLAYEAVARGLITEFPQQTQGYESLLTIARESDSAPGRALAIELSSLSGTPGPIKQSAAILAGRYDLVGQSFADVLKGLNRSQLAEVVKPGSPTIIYTWATWSPSSLQFASSLNFGKKPRATIIGLNLDHDSVSANEWARTNSPPGILIDDEQGLATTLAARLKIDAAPLVYFVDAKGIIRDVRGLEGFADKLSLYGL